MKRLIWATVIAVVVFACATVNKFPPIGTVVIEAQSLPYAATITWTASVDPAVTGYNCYLDGVLVTSVGLVTTCSISIPALGPHTIGVTAVGAAAIPSESSVGLCAPPLPTSCAFKLGQPSAASGVKIK